MTKEILNIIGGGLAGCEAAWQAANLGVKVRIHEMRKADLKTPAHHTKNLAELVCSNSFRNHDVNSAIGLLHAEMLHLDSLIIKTGHENRVPAGSALAVDRDGFSQNVEKAIINHPNIEIVNGEITELPTESGEKFIIATGPLTSDKLAKSIQEKCDTEHLAFFDAIAPIIHKDSINFDVAWFQSRYDKSGTGGDGKDYINCPMTEAEYYAFVDSLMKGEKTEFKEWEKDTPYFDACLPIEVMAERGVQTLSFGPMKPVGLTNPHQPDIKPYAVVQLRQDNKLGTLYNMVGFQTKLKYGAQKEIFTKIPGLENAEFARFGGIHRNSFIKSPELLDEFLRLKKFPHIRFAGQVTGVEGYVESSAIGLLAGRFAAAEILGKELKAPPKETAIGSLLLHITKNAEKETFQPMNINFGLFPEIESSEIEGMLNAKGKQIKKLKNLEKKEFISQRAMKAIRKFT